MSADGTLPHYVRLSRDEWFHEPLLGDPDRWLFVPERVDGEQGEVGKVVLLANDPYEGRARRVWDDVGLEDLSGLLKAEGQSALVAIGLGPDVVEDLPEWARHGRDLDGSNGARGLLGQMSEALDILPLDPRNVKAELMCVATSRTAREVAPTLERYLADDKTHWLVSWKRDVLLEVTGPMKACRAYRAQPDLDLLFGNVLTGDWSRELDGEGRGLSRTLTLDQVEWEDVTPRSPRDWEALTGLWNDTGAWLEPLTSDAVRREWLRANGLSDSWKATAPDLSGLQALGPRKVDWAVAASRYEQWWIDPDDGAMLRLWDREGRLRTSVVEPTPDSLDYVMGLVLLREPITDQYNGLAPMTEDLDPDVAVERYGTRHWVRLTEESVRRLWSASHGYVRAGRAQSVGAGEVVEVRATNAPMGAESAKDVVDHARVMGYGRAEWRMRTTAPAADAVLGSVKGKAGTPGGLGEAQQRSVGHAGKAATRK